MSILTEKQSTALSENEGLQEQLKKLLKGFAFDGNVIKLNKQEIEEDDFLLELKSRYRNPNKPSSLLSKNIEEVLPFVETFNEKRFWWVMPTSGNIHLVRGQKLVFQDGQSIVVNAGEYLDGGYFSKPKESTENDSVFEEQNAKFTLGEQFVYLYRNRKLDLKRESYFVYIEGDYAIKMFDKPMIRFYFHLSPDNKEEILRWAKFLQDTLNEYRIPFGVKYPFNLKNYNYADAGVLYITQNHFPLVAPIIQEIADRFKSILQSNVPLFTLKLYNGIGFAESPLSISESFGTHRRALIWKIIKNKLSYTNGNFVNLDNNIITNEIIRLLKEEDYTEEFYRHAKTKYEYNFETYLSKERQQFKNWGLPKRQWNWLLEFTNSYIQSIEKYNNFIDNFGRLRFQNIAENYGKDLIEKAIWNPESDSYDWLTYDQDNEQEFYRMVDETEKYRIHLFLSELAQITSDNYYQNAADKIKFNHKSIKKNPSLEKAPTPLDEIFAYLDDKTDKEFVEIVVEIQEQLDTLPDLAKLSIEDLKKAAQLIDKYFEKLSLPMKNTYGNYEYCPTYKGKLKMGFLFLTASRARNLKELLSLYKDWYSNSKKEAQNILQIGKIK
ncbi:T3SS effector HopA1 family protein [Runella sp. SP2]|uniref:T3SS effector HopA1 family protein n=1 Tax=Runella sp. SP2 TaxID=2268026 RepID=UPI000F07A9A1|nr:T3SS effector HopA1 family protein [Runella sp. SP2]AYQ35311.1 hypothetical protein DTQ70_25495 [Runella sp. SP2]